MFARCGCGIRGIGLSAATPEVPAALFKGLTDPDGSVRRPAALAIEGLSGYVRAEDRTEAVKLLLPLARSRNEESRQAVYVSLRNLLAAEAA
jgi:HEAT repeat protein